MKRSYAVAVAIAVAALAQAVVVLAARDPAIRDGLRRVDVTYFMESLCPDCAMFGVNELDAAIGNLSEYMNLEIVRKSQPSPTTPLVSSLEDGLLTHFDATQLTGTRDTTRKPRSSCASTVPRSAR